MKRRNKLFLMLFILAISVFCIKNVSYAYVENSSVAVINTFYAFEDDKGGGDDDGGGSTKKDDGGGGDGSSATDGGQDKEKTDNSTKNNDSDSENTSDTSGDAAVKADESSTENISNAKTGDNTNIMLWTMMLCVSVLILIQVIALERGLK